ncbi:MAG: sialidase family protein [bacterium]
MLSKITQVSGNYPLAAGVSKLLFEVPDGQYRSRKAAVVKTAAGEIKLAWSDQPYVTWSSLTTLAADAADQPFDAVMDEDGHIHLVYSETSTYDLVTRKITFSGGSWTAGSQVTIYAPYESFKPSLVLAADGTLWVGWVRKDGSTYYLQVKSSSDGGATWGSGSSDGGDILTPAVTALDARLAITDRDLYAVCTHGGDTISMRSRSLGGSSWAATVDLASATGAMDEHFDVAVAASGLLGVVWDQGGLRYREFNGSNWDSVVELDAEAARWPQLRFNGNVPVVTYLTAVSSDQVLLRYTDRRTGSFSEGAVLDGAATTFANVQIYDLGSFSYADVTSAAASNTTADVYHPASGVMLNGIGDCLCLGMAHPFRYLKLLLATAGSGGTVAYSYWNGQFWQGFTPAGGQYNLDAVDHDLLLWQDYHAIPDDWQKQAVAGQEALFWIKIQTTSTFTTGPVGSQITAISDLKGLLVGR